MHYVYSLRIWLTGRKAKSAFIEDESGFRIGSEVKVKLEKSRFGTQGRNCAFKILWGTEEVGIQDAESWLEAIKGSDNLKQAGAWFSLVHKDGKEEKFQTLIGLKSLKTRSSKPECLRSWMNRSFVSLTREGSAEDFYDVDKE